MFIYNGNNFKVKAAVGHANGLINKDEFLKTIKAKNSFDYADVDGEFIGCMIEKFAAGMMLQLKVIGYRKRWSRAYGYFIPSKPDYIYINEAKLDRSVASITASLCHEMIHYLDSRTPYSFGHGNNSPRGKQNSAPYWIDNIAEAMIEEKPVRVNTDNYRIKYYNPWYRRLWARIKRVF